MNTTRLTPVFAMSMLVAAMTLLAGGCQSDIKTRTYSVNVANESSSPVTVWLTKDGPVWEKGWVSPEDQAIVSRGAGEMISGVVVQPGKTASVGPKTGAFASASSAVLRVYLGQHNMSDLLAINKGDPDRKDFELDPGRNDFTIAERNGNVFVQRGTSGGGTPMNMSSEGSSSSGDQR